MLTDFRALWLPRGGNEPEHYEDACAADASRGRFALADGATESAFAGLWARLLVEHFVEQSGDVASGWHSSLAVPREQWNAQVRSRVLPWYGEAGVQRGAFATFLGVVVEHSETCSRWQAAAVGDTCLFHTRENLLLRAFPIEDSTHFDNVPRLLASRECSTGRGDGEVQWLEGNAATGDRLWLATDALAQWFLAEHEVNGGPWARMEEILAASAPEEQFASAIEDLRGAGRLRNDDVTLMRIIA
jgi:hypothetical protein